MQNPQNEDKKAVTGPGQRLLCGTIKSLSWESLKIVREMTPDIEVETLKTYGNP